MVWLLFDSAKKAPKLADFRRLKIPQMPHLSFLQFRKRETAQNQKREQMVDWLNWFGLVLQDERSGTLEQV